VKPTPLIVDASAVVEVLRATDLGGRVADALRGHSLAAPAHLDAEVLSALGRHVRGGWTAPDAVERALEQLRRLPIERLPLPPLLQRAWRLREVVALRDGLYVAGTEALGGVLLTLDGRLARSAGVPVECPT
jgi:predicted nucleic acid-binding protein